MRIFQRADRNRQRCGIAAWIAVAVLVIGSWCQPARATSPDCPTGGLVLSGAMLTNICWQCVFPIRIAGGFFTGSSSGIPSAAATEPLCICNNDPGVTIGLWMPSQIIELVRTPGCSLALGGIELPGFNVLQQGTAGERSHQNSDGTFYNYHTYVFPVTKMLSLFTDSTCFSGGLSDFDIAYISEVDPTWTYDELAFLTDPEDAAVSNLPAQMACAGDAAATLVGQPIDSLFWCAGSWGDIYPLSGNANGQISIVQNMSLLATRALAAAHRRGLAYGTMGNGNVCGGTITTVLPKSQYQMSMFYPLPETSDKHWIGESTYEWGEWRVIPAVGEDDEYLIWDWTDCCAEFNLP